MASVNAVRYRSISLDGFFDASREQQAGKWIVTPKVHGANLSVIIRSGKAVEDAICRRNGVLSDGEYFYGAQEVIRALRVKLAAVAACWPEGTAVTVYGEIFGGHYLGLTAPKKGVQKGICYSDEVLFIAFDVRTDADGYLPYSDAVKLFEAAKLPHVPVYHIADTLADALVWAREHVEDCVRVSDFTAKTLPPLEENVGEGYVIRNAEGKDDDLMVKIKSSRFAETIDEDFLTPARVAAVLSKEVIVERSATTPHLVSLVLADVEAASGLKSGSREQKKAKALVNRYLDTVYFPAADSVGVEAD